MKRQLDATRFHFIQIIFAKDLKSRFMEGNVSSSSKAHIEVFFCCISHF